LRMAPLALDALADGFHKRSSLVCAGADIVPGWRRSCLPSGPSSASPESEALVNPTITGRPLVACHTPRDVAGDNPSVKEASADQYPTFHIPHVALEGDPACCINMHR